MDETIRWRTIDGRTLDSIQKESMLNQDILLPIYRNPLLRDLPRIASLYGMYACFLVGQVNLYFICGYNSQLVMNEPFVTINGDAYPSSYYKKYGELSSPDLFTLDWRAFQVNINAANIAPYIGGGMARMELIRRRMLIHGIKPTPFIYMPSDDAQTLEKFQEYANIPRKLNPSERGKNFKTEENFLLDRLIPEWPIRPDSEKPGYIAWVNLSSYRYDTIDGSTSRRLYQNQKEWQKAFNSKDNNTNFASITRCKTIMDYLKKELDKRGIPYKYPITHEESLKRMQDEINFRKKRFFRDDSDRDDLDESIQETIWMNRYDALIVPMLEWEFGYSQFSQECIDYGKELYSDRHRTPVYGFTLMRSSSDAYTQFKRFAEANQIQYGVMPRSEIRTAYADSIELITEFYNMPIVEMYLQISDLDSSAYHSAAYKEEWNWHPEAGCSTFFDKTGQFVLSPIGRPSGEHGGQAVTPKKYFDKYIAPEENLLKNIMKRSNRIG